MTKKFIHLYTSVKKYAFAHTVMSGIILVVVLAGGYWGYGKLTSTSGETRYVVAQVQKGTLVVSVTGTGQVSTSNQLDVKPKVSGEILSVPIKNGQAVQAGALIAEIDPTQAQKAVRDAEASLESAQISLQKLQKPADQLSITQAENTLAQAQEAKRNATDDLAKAYSDGFNSVSDTFIDLPETISGLYDILFKASTQLGGTSQENIDFYANVVNRYTNTLQGAQFKTDTQTKYAAAKTTYDTAFADYKNTSRASTADTTASLITESNDAVNKAVEAVKSANNLVQLYKDTSSNYGATPSSYALTQISTLNGYMGTLNSHATKLSAALNTIKTSAQSIASADRSITADQQSLDKLKSGADQLDVRSSELTVTQRKNALQDAKDNLADYFVRAPFAGTIAVLNVKVHDFAGSAAIATIVTQSKIAELSLNEVDAASAAVGNKATLTFDAVPNLTIAGAVSEIDTVGTVSQGVVTYKVKISFDTQDNRVKPGMSVSAAIQTAVKQDVLLVPSSAVKTQGDSSYVQVFSPPLAGDTVSSQGIVSKQTPQQIPVQIGLSNDTSTEIVSGLKEGEQVIARTISASSQTTTTQAPSLFGGAPARAGAGAGTRVQAR
ncbi:MAG: efflux RND transporter periplasmic adaptor subunit [bacterium]|nr:efflux RND transporter periplasmic adaptor subunit [bacterium]